MYVTTKNTEPKRSMEEENKVLYGTWNYNEEKSIIVSNLNTLPR